MKSNCKNEELKKGLILDLKANILSEDLPISLCDDNEKLITILINLTEKLEENSFFRNVYFYTLKDVLIEEVEKNCELYVARNNVTIYKKKNDEKYYAITEEKELFEVEKIIQKTEEVSDDYYSQQAIYEEYESDFSGEIEESYRKEIDYKKGFTRKADYAWFNIIQKITKSN